MTAHRALYVATALGWVAAICGAASPAAAQGREGAADDATADREAGPDDLTPPRLLEGARPRWPGAPRSEDVVVVVTAVIDASGRVREAEVVTPTEPALDAVAIEAVRGWRFAPAERSGEAVPARVRVEVRFSALGRADAALAEPSNEAGEIDGLSDAGLDDAGLDDAGLDDAGRGEPPTAAASIGVEGGPIDVSVSGARRQPPPEAAGDFQIDPGALRDVPRRHAEQMLTLAPGFFLSNHGGEGHPSSVFLRGFDAGEGQDIRFEVDGVVVNEPSNAHSHGYADTNFVIPELIRSLRVLEGPFDPRQGDFAVAGSAEFELGLEERGVILHGAYGSYNRRRVMALWGPDGTTERTFAGFDLQAGDGFGPNRAWTSARGMAQYELVLSPDLRILFAGQGYAAEFDGAGILREDDYDARRIEGCAADADSQFFCTYDPNQGGQVTRFSANVRLEYDTPSYALRQQIYGVSRRSRLRENITGFVTDVANDGPQRGDGVAQTTEAFTFGARGSYRHHLDWLDHRHDVELGYLVRHDRGASIQHRLRRFGGEPYTTDFDNEIAITNIGGYLAGRLRPLDWLVLRGGARIDAFTFAVDDQNRPTSDRDGERVPMQTTEAFGWALLPRASAQVIFIEGLSAIVSYGMGARSSDAAALSDGELAPFARVNAFEAGLVYARDRARATSFDTRLIGYLTKVDRDLLFNPVAGRNELVGASNRFGAVASARLRTVVGVETQASVTYAEAYLPAADAGFFDLTSGVRLPFIPRWVGRIDTSIRRAFSLWGERFGWELASGASYVGPPPLPLNQLGEDIFVMDVAGRLRWRFVEAGVEVTNLFDRRNRIAQFNHPSNFASPEAPASQLAARHFAAGAPLQALGTVTLHFDTSPAPTPEDEANDGK